MKVLVADDDRGSLLVAQAAVQQSGHDCIVASDGDMAWQLYQEHRPEVVVSDLMMPGLNGLDLCRAIRADESDLYTYVVLLTSHGARDDVLAGMEAGADDYVTKPLDPFTLHTRLLAAMRVTSLHAELASYRSALAAQARTDPLTGLHNRLKLAEDLQLMESSSERYGHGYALAIVDVDNFKSYNDIYGHPAGDAALQAVARVLAEQSRDSDGVYRYGGEEFLFLLPGQPLDGARSIVERTRAAVQELGIVHAGGTCGVLTLSVGISATWADRGVDGRQLLKEADAALYAAKTAGRNMVAVAAVAEQS
ncbi:GGDEF domain-containing protein [Arthrobacter sp. 35W]|uniref:GGDEF domain-containing protein n=1 Tax=Arthrobacter sp. 35W TaxID=1132441 RepID=UPI00041A54A8|nr:diguanylate cyclase [Arthrobacter sp. 35W]